jgi:hypothetical protein
MNSPGLKSAVLFISCAAMPAHPDIIADRQRAAGQSRAAELHLRIVHEIEEFGASAVTHKNRFAMHALFNYLDDHPEVRHVIFPSIGRVARTYRDFEVIHKRLAARNIVICTADFLMFGHEDPLTDLINKTYFLAAEQEARRRVRMSRKKRATA